MSFRTLLIALLPLSACAPTETSFLNDFVPQHCSIALACYSDAAISFSGWDTQEACIAGLGETIVTQTADCAYNPDAAQLCLQHLDEAYCTDDDTISWPLECSDVYTDCESWL